MAGLRMQSVLVRAVAGVRPTVGLHVSGSIRAPRYAARFEFSSSTSDPSSSSSSAASSSDTGAESHKPSETSASTSSPQSSASASTSSSAPTAPSSSQASLPAAASAGASNRSVSTKKETKEGPLRFPVVPLRFDAESLATFPTLLKHPHPILDAGTFAETIDPFTGAVRSRVEFFNSETPIFDYVRSEFADQLPASAQTDGDGGGGSSNMEAEALKALADVTPLSVAEISQLHRHVLLVRRVVTMRTKGKLASMYALVVAGNGNGLVGYGEGKDDNAGKAARKAFNEAVKSLGYVTRWEGRTLEGEARGKWSASEVVLRPRPTGFGLRVPPVIHAIARSAGLSDLSASIRGSSNPVNVVKATIGLLCGGAAAPPGLGDGLGGSLRRGDRGRGMRERAEISRARGRNIEEVLR
ncbi:28S ribosomal protein S5, mitochondrial [Tilletia horrida]|uniref:Small ribosomal subunit protein uS5m n=1 Tax=Tilletia horrida TaxID=155126 RepID=A0AAN6GLS3_9BASI|nr:28S ribosomal protein S5, mitochondrial [Tilletia horrida]KAK0550565.1 28S ribosomal protein S5, mitochondrial [Tilletia horrida]KAK0560285.1 28S ribosomal protein S5, mitochondrial [Tilletia horrida]